LLICAESYRIATWFLLYIYFLLDYTTTSAPTTTNTNTKGKNKKTYQNIRTCILYW
jgi:hypothetical protein